MHNSRLSEQFSFCFVTNLAKIDDFYVLPGTNLSFFSFAIIASQVLEQESSRQGHG